MTQDRINELNNLWGEEGGDTWDQGIFTEPNWIPNDVKEPVIYWRWSSSGASGGNCWGDEARDYYSNEPEPNFGILDFVLKQLKPDLTFLQYKEIERKLVKDNYETKWEYYGNYTNWKIKYVVVSELEKYLSNV